jgi:N-methylhydantoinase B
MSIDKVTLQILANHCAAAAESMAHTLMRTAHSTFVKETEDFSTGLATPEGETFASPTSIGATWFVGLDYGPAIARIADYEEGDICLTNDPYSGFVCTHTPDIHLWKPVFWQGELVCFTVGHIHNTDVGGAVPASLSRTLTEIHQEGIRIPPVKLMRRGVFDETVRQIMLTNVRVPEQNWGDLKAQIAAMNTGERKVHEIIARFGIATFRQGIRDLMDYAEQQARNIVRQIPDGDYFFADYADEDSAGGYPCRLALTLRVRGDGLVMDFTGSDPQLASSLNIPTGGRERHVVAMVGLVYTLYTLDKTILLNSGILRAARAVLPEGTVMNPVFPAAVGMRSLTGLRVQTLIFGAFSLALPDRIPAGPAAGSSIMNVKTTDRQGRSIMASIDPIAGGGGGMPFADGPDGSGANSSFLKNTPVEINEAEVPIEIIRYGLVRDSGGAGRFRGGLASMLEFKVFAPQTMVTARNRDRSRFQSWGVRGGRAGKPSTFLRNPGSNHEIDLGNTDIVHLEPDDVIRVISCGAGGYGSPLDRPASAVLRDVRCGFVSEEAAREEYGVVIRGDAVDEAATEALRREMRPFETDGHFDLGAARDAYERLWTRERYDALTEILAGLPVNWRFFIKHKIFAAMEEKSRSGSVDGEGAALIHRVFRDIAGGYRELAIGR